MPVITSAVIPAQVVVTVITRHHDVVPNAPGIVVVEVEIKPEPDIAVIIPEIG
jgi:hypothetical protein